MLHGGDSTRDGLEGWGEPSAGRDISDGAEAGRDGSLRLI